jgi:hypothetical protein
VEGELQLEVIAVGQRLAQIDGGRRGGRRATRQHDIGGAADGKRRGLHGQDGVLDRAVLIGRLDVDLHVHLGAVDGRHQALAGRHVALGEDLAEGHFVARLGDAGVVLELQPDDIVGAGRLNDLGAGNRGGAAATGARR